MYIGLVYDAEYPKRYPFTAPDFIIDIIRKLNARLYLITQLNLNDVVEKIDEMDALIILANALHNPFIGEFFHRDDITTLLLDYVKCGMGIIIFHQSRVDEYILANELGVGISWNESFENISLMCNLNHPVFHDIPDFAKQIVKEYEKVTEEDKLLKNYALFTACADPLSPVIWLIKEKKGSQELIRCAEVRYGLGKIIYLFSHFEWFKIGEKFLRNLIEYAAKKSLLSYDIEPLGTHISKFSVITINTDKESTHAAVNVKLHGDTMIIKLNRPMWLTHILTQRLVKLFAPYDLNGLKGVPLIRGSPTMTIDSLLPLVALDRDNVMYQRIYLLIMPKLKPKNLRQLILHAPSYVKAIAIFDLLKNVLSEDQRRNLEGIINEIHTSLRRILSCDSVELTQIEGESFHKIINKIQLELEKTSLILRRILDPEEYERTFINKLHLISKRKFRRIPLKELCLSYNEILQLVHRSILSARLLSEAITSLIINPELELLWLITEHLLFHWNLVNERVYLLPKEIVEKEKMMLRLSQLEESMKRLQAQYLSAINEVQKAKAELENLKARWIVIKGRTTDDFLRWLKRNGPKLIAIISAILLLIQFFEYIMKILLGL